MSNKLLVSINGGSYQEIFSSMEEKVSISFKAQDEDSEPALSISLANGTTIKLKYAKTKTNAVSIPENYPE